MMDQQWMKDREDRLDREMNERQDRLDRQQLWTNILRVVLFATAGIVIASALLWTLRK